MTKAHYKKLLKFKLKLKWNWEYKKWKLIENILTLIEWLLQFFSVALVHFSEQKWNFQNYLFNLHII